MHRDAIAEQRRVFLALLPLIHLTRESMNKRSLLRTLLAGSKNVRFADMVGLVEAFGFRLSRMSGSHHIFVHPEVSELVNLQNVHGQAKPYQIWQFLKLVEKYDLKLEDE